MEEVEREYVGGMPVAVNDGTRIARYCEAWPDVFAGQWIEHGSSRVVAFTESIDEHLEAIRRLVYAPERVLAVQFRYSQRHLRELQHRIVEILGTSDGLTDLAVNVRNNRVIVRVLPDRLDEVRQVLKESHPDEVDVELGGPIINL